ncbi:MAG: glycosyltransferase family 2 protein [Gemmataceae bacterium]
MQLALNCFNVIAYTIRTIGVHSARPRPTGESMMQNTESLDWPEFASANSAGARLSIVFPLFELRWDTVKCLSSFCTGQTLPRELYEVIVVSDGADEERDQHLRAVLGPGDRFVVHPGANRAQMCNIGVANARTELIFSTESHCLAHPRCLEEIMKYLARHEVDAASVASYDGCVNSFARVEARRFNELKEVWDRPDDWRKIMIRGFAIPRKLWQEMGGLDERFPKFCEWLLAARMHERGQRIGVADRARVTHFYNESFQDLFEFSKKYATEECACRLELPEDFCRRYFGARAYWNDRESFRGEFARQIAVAALRTLGHCQLQPRGAQKCWAITRELVAYLSKALWGARFKAWQARLGIGAARIRCWLWRNNETRLLPAYIDACKHIERCHHLQFIQQLCSRPYQDLAASLEYPADLILERQLIGFHDLEHWRERAFRWTSPVAAILLELPRGDYDLRLDTGEILADPVRNVLGLFFNGARIRPGQISMNGTELVSRIETRSFRDRGPQVLTIISGAQNAPDDPRTLGIPIFGIRFTPASGSRPVLAPPLGSSRHRADRNALNS